MKPKISICIPTFNRSDLLRKALRSVELQTEKPFEVLVVDNASTDDTKKVVTQFKHIGVKYFRNKHNVGMVNNWNECIKRAKGEYLTLLHNDDLIAPDWYKEMSQAIKRYPKIKFFMCSLLIIDKDESIQHIYHTFRTSQVIPSKVAIKKFWTHLLPGFAPTAANVYHKDLFKKIGLFEEKYKTEADVVSSTNILANFDVFYLAKALFAYRSHADQGFDLHQEKKGLEEELKRKKNHYKIVKQFYKKLYKTDLNKRFFLQYPIFMTLSPITLFLVKLDLKKVFSHFKLARDEFPDLFTKVSDLYIYVWLLLIFIKRKCYTQVEVYRHRHEYHWLQNF